MAAVLSVLWRPQHSQGTATARPQADSSGSPPRPQQATGRCTPLAATPLHPAPPRAHPAWPRHGSMYCPACAGLPARAVVPAEGLRPSPRALARSPHRPARPQGRADPGPSCPGPASRLGPAESAASGPWARSAGERTESRNVNKSSRVSSRDASRSGGARLAAPASPRPLR